MTYVCLIARTFGILLSILLLVQAYKVIADRSGTFLIYCVESSTTGIESKKSPCGFLTFFPNCWEFLINFLHTYYTFISTLDCKFLLNYLQF